MRKGSGKYSTVLSKVYRYLFDFIVVFSGVFLAFWLTEQKDQKIENTKRREIYIAIYEDLNQFYESGRRENKKGFINFFIDLDVQLDSLILNKSIPLRSQIYGDYWKVPIVNSFVQTGLMKDIDIKTFKRVTRFNVVHQNLLQNIEDYNNFYGKYVTAEYDKGVDFFYQADTNRLKPKYSYLYDALTEIAKFSELLVEVAREVSLEIKENHID